MKKDFSFYSNYINHRNVSNITFFIITLFTICMDSVIILVPFSLIVMKQSLISVKTALPRQKCKVFVKI